MLFFHCIYCTKKVETLMSEREMKKKRNNFKIVCLYSFYLIHYYKMCGTIPLTQLLYSVTLVFFRDFKFV